MTRTWADMWLLSTCSKASGSASTASRHKAGSRRRSRSANLRTAPPEARIACRTDLHAPARTLSLSRPAPHR
eukprot:3781521-Rhodomonas_salina.7